MTPDVMIPAAFRRLLSRSVLLPPVLFGLLAFVFLGQLLYLLSAAEWVDHTDQVIARANGLLKLLVDGETGMRGYLITDDPVFLEPYHVEEAQTGPAFEELKELVADNPAQCERLKALTNHHVAWQDFAKRVIKLRREGGDYKTIVRIGEGKRRMDAIREQVATFIRVEEELREDRTRTARRATWVIVGVSLTLALVLGSGLAVMIRRQLQSVSASYQCSLNAVEAQAESLHLSAQRLDALHEIDRATLAAEPLPELTRSALRRMERVVPSRDAFVVLFDPGEPAQVITRTDHSSEMVNPADGTFPEFSERDCPLAVADLAKVTGRTPVQERLFRSGHLSCVAVPLRADESLFGVLVLADPRSSAFSDGHQQVADEVGRQLEIAFQQHRLRDLVRRHTDELERRVAERTVDLEVVTVALRLQIDERERAQEELRERALQLRATDRRLAELVEGMSEAWFVLDAEWRFTFVNDRSETLLRHRRDDMLGKPIWEVFNRLVGTPMEMHYRRAMTQRVPVSFVAYSPIAERWLDIRLFPTGDGLAAFLLDIHDRKLAEDASRESEGRFRLMANSIPQLAWIAHSDGYIFWYNQRWYDYTGTTSEQMEGWGWQSVHDPEMLPTVMGRWKSAIDAGLPFDMEFPLRGSDGRFRAFLTRIEPFKDSEARVVQWFGTNTDVDELKQMEESLRGSQARLNSALAAGSIGTWTWDIVNDRLIADEFTARMFSIEPDGAANGLPVEVYLRAVKEEDQQGVADGLGRAIQSCGHYDIEYRVRQKDGEFRWLQAMGRVEGDEAGNALIFHGAVIDITDRKRTDDALRASEALAKASLREKEVLLKEIHHRVKNNLQIVSTLLDLQSGFTTDRAALEMFQESRGRVKSMALIHERLYRAQDMARVDFTEYISQLTDDLFRTYKISGDIRLELDVDIPPLTIDIAIPCGLLLNELISNCLKHAFTGASQGCLRVTLHRDNGASVLTVTDDGPGFPAGTDFRNTTSFGLQLVTTLVDQLDGEISMTSDRGTTFTVRFPASGPPHSAISVGSSPSPCRL